MQRGRRSPLWAKWWDRVVIVGIVAAAVFGYYGIINANTTANSNNALVTQAVKVGKHAITVSNRHHAQNAAQQSALQRKDDEIIAQGKELKADAALLKNYSATLVAYHSQTASILTQLVNVQHETVTLQQEFDADVAKNSALTASAAAALTGGQNTLTTLLASIAATGAETDAALSALCAAVPAAKCPSS